MAIFRSSFYTQYRPGKCALRYSRTQKRISKLYKQDGQKVKKMAFFSKGLTHGLGPKMPIFPTFFF